MVGQGWRGAAASMAIVLRVPGKLAHRASSLACKAGRLREAPYFLSLPSAMCSMAGIPLRVSQQTPRPGSPPSRHLLSWSPTLGLCHSTSPSPTASQPPCGGFPGLILTQLCTPEIAQSLPSLSPSLCLSFFYSFNTGHLVCARHVDVLDIQPWAKQIKSLPSRCFYSGAGDRQTCDSVNI